MSFYWITCLGGIGEGKLEVDVLVDWKVPVVSLVRQVYPLEGPERQSHHTTLSGELLVLSPAKVVYFWTVATSWIHYLLSNKHNLLTLLAALVHSYFTINVFLKHLSSLLGILMGYWPMRFFRVNLLSAAEFTKFKVKMAKSNYSSGGNCIFSFCLFNWMLKDRGALFTISCLKACKKFL